MRASKFEYQFRFILHALIFFLGFSPMWLAIPGTSRKTTWITLATLFSEHRWLSFFTATDFFLVIAIVLMALAAFLRVWGAAYVGSSVVVSPTMHGSALLADGPYRRTRNPLYLGTLLHTVGISMLMPVSGAVFAIVLIWILQIRLALAEEPFLASRFGQSYLEYEARVPRFLPALTPQVPAAGKQPRWIQAVLGELYFVLACGVLAIWGWEFNAQPLYRGILISLGAWLVVRAFLPKAPVEG
jgi:protein-S-isoprenylcysteine O-methyltransferase Ste14